MGNKDIGPKMLLQDMFVEFLFDDKIAELASLHGREQRNLPFLSHDQGLVHQNVPKLLKETVFLLFRVYIKLRQHFWPFKHFIAKLLQNFILQIQK